MSFWTAVVVIVAIVAFANIRIAKLHAQGDRSRRHFGPFARFNEDHAAPQDRALETPREHELEREVEQLRDRIHVLERIATDANSLGGQHSRSIAAEIEALRDEK